MKKRRKLPIVLGDIPQLIKTENLINSFSVMELRDILETCSFELGQNLDIQPRSPLGAAFHRYPQIFIHTSDEYMGALLRTIISHKDQDNSIPAQFISNRVMVFTGYGQCQSLPEYFFRSNKSLQECLKVKPKFQTIVTDDDPAVQIDKLAIIQVMGERVDEISQELVKQSTSPQNYFKNKLISQHHKLLIKYYSNDLGSHLHAVDNYDLCLHLYKELCHKYRLVVEKKTKEGRRQLEKMFHLHMLNSTDNF